MANRRPPLFELLQKESEARQKGDAADGRPGVLSGGQVMSTGAPAKPNGQAEGSVESKPAATERNGSATSTIDDLSERAEKQDRAAASPPVARPKAPMRRAKPKAAVKPKPAEAQPQPEKGGGAADWSAMHPKRTVSFQMIWVYSAVGLGLVTVISVWALAYSLGVGSEKAKFEEYLRQSDQSTLIRDPIAGGAATAPNQPNGLPAVTQESSGTSRIEPAPVTAQQVDPTPAPVEQQQVAAPTIDVFEDIRKAGNNYLKLASGMAMDRAQGLAEHLTANGVRAMALDEGRQGFGLYTAFPVPSGQYRSLAPQRRELESRVVDLLESVPADLGGPYVPRDQLWMRFDG